VIITRDSPDPSVIERLPGAKQILAQVAQVETLTTPSGLVVLGAQEIAAPKKQPTDHRPPQKPSRAVKREAMAEVAKITGQQMGWKATRKWLKRNSRIRKP
jgi:hypothetical protein